jgi:hypothetical protein
VRIVLWVTPGPTKEFTLASANRATAMVTRGNASQKVECALTVVTSPLARVANCVYQDMRVIQQIESPVDTLEEVVPYLVIVSEGDRFQMNATMECASARYVILQCSYLI